MASIMNGLLPDVTFLVEDDGVYRETPVSPLFSKRELLIPKNVFIEAFNKYIKETEE